MYIKQTNLVIFLLISVIFLSFLFLQTNTESFEDDAKNEFADNEFRNFFYNKPKRFLIHKWDHYFPIYEKHFKKFKNKNPVILEIGIFKGGSIDMWNYYFDNKCTLYCVDIDPECKKFENESKNVKVFIGDQEDPNFWDSFFEKNDIQFDMVIEDGGHTMQQQIVTYEKVINRVKNGGVYLCEDLHTSYWNDYGGGYKNKNSFIEYSKNFIDLINAYHIKENQPSLDFRKRVFCISYYDSIMVLDIVNDNDAPKSIEMI